MPGSLKLLSSEKSVCVLVSVRVSRPQAIKTIQTRITDQTVTSLLLFSFFMTLAINITDGCGLSNKACHELMPKKSIMLYFTVKGIYSAVHY